MLSAMAVKNRLQEWMDEKGLNQQETVDLTGIHVTTIRRIAKNQSNRVDIDTMSAICKAFGKSVSDFWYDDEEEQSHD